ncbi:hypothetical protein AWW67_06895 [Roseivirga seohaensis]|uniref:Uncharacterized protein n=1 Tax=Roseivirga seohaensis TaxID=1914963 RepID=A0A150XWY7_9BACT|nr:hypothetical protein [Roseivirga seohaensis]KYG83142.1 hypothetical protein AWW67_06895 [Roseivirga seohaensis]
MLINSKEAFDKNIGSGNEWISFDEEVNFNINTAEENGLNFRIENKDFANSVRIDGEKLGTIAFVECTLKSIDLGPNLKMSNIQFIRCTIGEFDLDSFAELGRCLFQACNRIGKIFISPECQLSLLLIVDNKDIQRIDVMGKVDRISISNRSNEFKDSTNWEYLIPELWIDLNEVQLLSIDRLLINKLDLKDANSNTKIELKNSGVMSLKLKDLIKPDLKCYNIMPMDSDHILDTSFDNCDLDGAVFHHCVFNGVSNIYSSKLRNVNSFETQWPIEFGTHPKSLMITCRELKLLHQNTGDYRNQFVYHQMEMEAFKNSEWERLKNINGFFPCLRESVEYFIKVKLPSFASNFGLSSWKPLLSYFTLLLIVVNAFILFQGPELGLEYAFGINPLSWDWSLFWHLLLPVHSRGFNGVDLNIGIDSVWRILASFYIYHLILSSRRLLQQR